MKRLNGFFVALAFATYVAAVGLAIGAWHPALWIIGGVCVLMCAISHPVSSHLICAMSLVLMILVETGDIEWMSEFVPAFGIVVGLVYSTKMIEEAKKPCPEPTPEILCPLERDRREMERILRSECGDGD